MSTNLIAASLGHHIRQSRKQSGKEPLRRNAIEAEEVLADDDEEEAASGDNADRLQVLVDPDAQKLVMNTFKQYVSEDDFSELVMFIKDFDKLLFRYRKGKPLTREEIEEIEEDMGESKGKNKRAKNEQDLKEPALPEPDDDLDPEDVEPEIEGDTPDEMEVTDETEEDEYDEGPSVVVSRAKRVQAADDFKVCNECTGGTAGWCKSNGKCADKENGGPPVDTTASFQQRRMAIASALIQQRRR